MLAINDNMQEEMQKAAVLTEALPYIREFSGKTVVVKYGGSAMTDENLKKQVIGDVALLKLIGMKPIIVHGGGKEISKWERLKGREPEFINGLRSTDAETMEIAEMVLNKVNKSLVGLMEGHGLKAVGLCGKDGGTLVTTKKLSAGQDIGYVGEVVKTDTKLLNVLLDNDFIPVVAPIGIGEDNASYNINADDAACAVARAVNAEKLVFLTDIEGVFLDPMDKKTLISEMDVAKAKEYIEKGVVGGGMLPKLNNCIEAIENGVARVHILDGRLQHALLLELFTSKGIGTAILKEPIFK